MKTIRVVITSRPGTWQRFLQNDIGSYPFVQVIGVAHGSLTAVQLVKEHQPDMLLIDANIPVEEAIAILQNIKLENPSVLITIIADTNQDQRSLTKAGANYVVSTYELKSKMQDIFRLPAGPLITEAQSARCWRGHRSTLRRLPTDA